MGRRLRHRSRDGHLPGLRRAGQSRGLGVDHRRGGRRWLRWILDFGPSDLATRLTSGLVRGRASAWFRAALRVGQRNLFSPGGIPEVAAPWSQFDPILVELPDGRTVVETAFTRLTGRSPMLLAGMTPTTVDPAIVAAAANAGHWAELAGGGQVTEDLRPQHRHTHRSAGAGPRGAVQRTVPRPVPVEAAARRQTHRAEGTRAGRTARRCDRVRRHPELDDAVALVDEFVEAGLRYVAFKPGTVEQIRAVVRIAAESRIIRSLCRSRVAAPAGTIRGRTSTTCCWPPTASCAPARTW